MNDEQRLTEAFRDLGLSERGANYAAGLRGVTARQDAEEQLTEAFRDLGLSERTARAAARRGEGKPASLSAKAPTQSPGPEAASRARVVALREVTPLRMTRA